MTIDPNTFFCQITLKLCSSLDTNKALHNCLIYLRQFMPVDTMVFARYDAESCAINHVAAVNDLGLIETNSPIRLPKEIGEVLATALNSRDSLMFNTQLDSLATAIDPYVTNQHCSEILLPLHILDEDICYLMMQASGTNQYTKEHLQLITSVREPLTIAMSNAMGHQQVVEIKEHLMDDNKQLQHELSQLFDTKIIGADAGLAHVMKMVQQVAPLQSTALLFGETGVGKEVIASAIHRLSPRCDGPFIKVNCGAIPENLIDSELFGHEKGAFSGAITRNRGRFERAHGGTIFLDEIGELPPAAQVRLLRVLQSHEIERVGGSTCLPVDIRVIAATHRNLEKMVSEGKFREDLWFRLNAFPIIIPPLRHRRQDIPSMLQYFVAKKAKEFGFRCPPPIAKGALDVLVSHPWPGNVRELQNVVERALIQNKGRALTLDTFTISKHGNGPLSSLGDSCGCVFPCLSRQLNVPDVVAADKESFLALDELITQHIQQALELSDGQIHGPNGAAQMLGINPSTLRNRMNKLGITYGRKANG